MRRGFRSGLLSILCCAALASAFETATLLDNCNRTEGPPPSASWSSIIIVGTDVRSLQANGSVCVVETGTGNASAWWNAEQFAADQLVTVTMPDATGSTGQSLRLYVRLSDPGIDTQTDGYECRFEPSTAGPASVIRIFRYLNDSISGALMTESTTYDINDGHQVGCKAVGDQICAGVNLGAGWVQVGCATDSNITGAGYVGALLNTSLLNFDNFGACTLSGGVCAGAASPFFSRRRQ